MHLANPIWLWGLSGLLIPIAIHLLSRKQGKVIKFGSVRHLEDTDSRQFRSLRLNEFLLLALRSLLVIILVLFLAGVQFDTGRKKGKWLLIETGLEKDNEFSSLMDSLQKNGFEVRSLATGFPRLADNSATSVKPNYWNLIRELETESIEQAVILSYTYFEGFKGKRPTLPENVFWITKAPKPNIFAATLTQITEDSILYRMGNSSAATTTFSNQKKSSHDDSREVALPDTISIAMIRDSSFAREANIFLAALRAVDKKSSDVFRIKTFEVKNDLSQKADWVIWLAGELPARFENRNIIFYQPRENDQLLKRIENSTWILTQRLNEENVLQENFTVSLALLFNQEKNYSAKAKAADRRVLPETEMWSSKSSVGDTAQAAIAYSGAEKYLAIFFLFVFMIERWVAFKRNQ